MPMDNSNNQPDRLGNQHDPADDSNIMVEDAVSKFTWELSRNGEAQQVNGAVLAVLVSVALENGWKFPSETQPKANFIDLQLLNQLPGHFDDKQARKFSRESLRAIGKQGAETLGAEGAALSELLDFIYRGAFDLKKLDATSASGPLRPMCRILDIPDDLPTPAAKMEVQLHATRSTTSRFKHLERVFLWSCDLVAREIRALSNPEEVTAVRSISETSAQATTFLRLAMMTPSA